MFQLNIKISNTIDVPIYAQVKDEIIRLIMNGELNPGDSLLSMRQLAKELGISIITTKRAYRDLETAGYVHSVVGKGTYVSEQNSELQRERVLTEIEDYIEAMLKASYKINLSRTELDDMISIIEEDLK
ncbi:GntR family transcriptional regulator [Salinicoccus sp. Marseille-QA3877]